MSVSTAETEEHVLDLDASRREAAMVAPVVRLGGEQFTLPVQLPASILDPLFDGELDEIIAVLVDMASEANVGDPDQTDLGPLLARLRQNPLIIPKALKAAHSVFRNLIGEEQWPKWEGVRPTLPDYFKVARFAWSKYGVGLGEALGFGTSSTDDGDTSKPTFTRKASTRTASGSRGRTRN